jgi:dipeptidyl aminopeptidase/acylaminoacyl peptidase
MGDSDLEDGYSAIGNEEYMDVLGAWDWLIAEKGFTPEQIGVYGNSLGAATALVTFEFEPRVAAIFLNSPFANLPEIIGDELERGGYPRWLAPSAILAARLVSGDNLLAHNPEDAIRAAGTRPIYIVHSSSDQRIKVQNAERLMAVAQENEVNATVWYLDDVWHPRGMAAYPDEFGQHLAEFFGAALAAR